MAPTPQNAKFILKLIVALKTHRKKARVSELLLIPHTKALALPIIRG